MDSKRPLRAHVASLGPVPNIAIAVLCRCAECAPGAGRKWNGGPPPTANSAQPCAPSTKSGPCLLRMRAAPVMLARAILLVHDGRFGGCNGGVLHVVPLSAAVYGNGHRAAWILRPIGGTLPASGRAARSSCLWRPRLEPRPLPHCVGAQLLGRRALRAPAHRRRAVPGRRGAAPWPAGAGLGTCMRAARPRRLPSRVKYCPAGRAP